MHKQQASLKYRKQERDITSNLIKINSNEAKKRKTAVPSQHIVNAALGRAQNLLDHLLPLLNEIGHGQTKAVHARLVNLRVKISVSRDTTIL